MAYCLKNEGFLDKRQSLKKQRLERLVILSKKAARNPAMPITVHNLGFGLLLFPVQVLSGWLGVVIASRPRVGRSLSSPCPVPLL